MNQEKKEYKFQTEMEQLLHLLANSLYTNQDIFLRELISNASDALNKINFIALTDDKALKNDADLKIKITVDEKKQTFEIEDNGIGMTENDLIEKIGTVASSGTSQYLKNATDDQKKNVDLIGRFGVGFYSVFMVTDSVQVETRNYNDKQGYLWESNGKGAFSITPIEKKTRGTKVSFKLKKEQKDYASPWRVENIIKTYSDFVAFPIELNGEKKNQMNAIWAKNKSEIKKEDLEEFYKYISKKAEKPFSHFHFQAEAPVQFNALLFIPETTNPDLFSQQFDSNLHLYVKKVFIQDDCKELVPAWMRFFHGVVDSHDLPLNVSREVTQKSPIIQKINKYIVGRVIKQLEKWAEKDPEKFAEFWKLFGNFIKEGIYNDYTNKENLVKLFHCYSSKSPDKLINLQTYVDAMPEDQKEIYFIYGKNQETIELSPNIEYFKKNNIETLYLYEEIDPIIMGSIGNFADKAIISIDKAEIKPEDDQKDKKTAQEKENEEKSNEKFIEYVKSILNDQIQDVTQSKRLVDSPCTIVASKEAMDPNMERMMKMMNKDFEESKRVFEINFNHKLIHNLKAIREKNPQDKFLKDCIEQLYEGAALSEGILKNQAKISPRMSKIMDVAAGNYINTLSS